MSALIWALRGRQQHYTFAMLPAKLELKDPADVHVCTSDIHAKNSTTSYVGHNLNGIQLLVISN